MDELLENYAIENIEQVRALADELRLRIIDQLVEQPMTVTQLGEVLGIPANKVHYHVRELERVGLLKLVETREKGGILEKYYRSVAKNLSVPDSLLRSASPDELIGAVNEFLRVVTQGLLDAIRRDMREGSLSEVSGLSATSYWATNAEAKALDTQVEDLLKPYLQPRGVEGEHERRFVRFAHAVPAHADDTDNIEPTLAAPAAQPTPKPKQRHVFVAGAVHYSGKDLQKIVVSGEQLNIRVFGTGIFSEDVSAELVDQAIADFHLFGTLHASDEVQAVLKRKERERDKE